LTAFLLLLLFPLLLLLFPLLLLLVAVMDSLAPLKILFESSSKTRKTRMLKQKEMGCV